MGEIFSGYETNSVESFDGDLDDAIKKDKYPKYNPVEMNAGYQWQVGLQFTSIAQFREAIKE